jgi:elongation factor G
MGDITGDLSSRRGQISGMQTVRAETVVVVGQVPLSELNGYQSHLHSTTGGCGSYTVEFSHYDLVPPAMQQKMVSQHKPDVEE